MQTGQPSRTALAAAAHRAAHQVLERGAIFADPLALRILGPEAEDLVRDAEANPAKRRMRLFVAARARFAEDALAAAIAAGTRQVVMLGAGLDTYAYRAPLPDRLRLFEVDHPATQAWKRSRLTEAAIPLPDALAFAPVDFEHESLAGGLVAAGFDPAQRSFFSWLGVVPYLTSQTVLATLGFIAGLPGGSDVVFDYAAPPDAIADPAARAAREALVARVAAVGERFQSYFEPDALHAELHALDFTTVEDVSAAEIIARCLGSRASPSRGVGGHLVCAKR